MINKYLIEFIKNWSSIPEMEEPLIFINDEIVSCVDLKNNSTRQTNNIKLIAKYRDSEIKITFNGNFPFEYNKTEILIDGKYIKNRDIEKDIGKFWTPIFSDLSNYILSLYHEYKNPDSPVNRNQSYLFLELDLL